jgi:hypothetical protein
MPRSRSHPALWLLKKAAQAALCLLPFTFLIGWSFTRHVLGDPPSFFFHSLLACGTTFFLIGFILTMDVRTVLPVVVFFLIFLFGYYAKFYWIVWQYHLVDFNEIANSIDSNLLRVLYPDNLVRAFEYSTYGYVALACSSAWILFFRLVPASRAGTAHLPLDISCVKILLSASYFVFLLTAYLVLSLGIGVRGAENVALPFKLTGMITYAREFTFFLFLIVIAWAEERDHTPLFFFGVAGLALFVCSQMFIEASRGAPIGLVIALGTLWMVYKRFTPKRILFLGSVFIGVILLRPLLSIYRELKTFEATSDFSYLIAKSLRLLDLSQFDAIGFIVDATKVIFLRVIGVDSVLYLTDAAPKLFDLKGLMETLTSNVDFAQRFTQDVVGYGYQVTTHYSAPSLVGGSYLLGGVFFMAATVLTVCVVSQFAWKKAYNSRWLSRPVALVAVILFSFSVGSEGSFFNIIKEIFVFSVFILFLETALRTLRHWRHMRRGGHARAGS